MNEYVKSVAKITGVSPEEALVKMNRVRKLFGVTYREYYNRKMYDMSGSVLAKEAFKLQNKKGKRKETLGRVIKASGMTRKEVLSDIKRINEKGIKRINLLYYEKFQMYELEEENLDRTLRVLVERDSLRRKIKEDLKSIDSGEKTYADIETDIEEFRNIIRGLMTPVFRKKLEKIYYKGRDRDSNTNVEEIFVDMEVTRLLLRFSFVEYMAFHFDEKTFEDKRSYLSNKERIAALKQYNDEESCSMLDNKAECYKVLKDNFGRQQVYVEKEEDIEFFREFCRKKKSFVKKPLYKSMGRGVEAIKIDKETDLKALLSQILDESGSFAAEESIKQHRSMRAFNPSSVNTVRLETFFDGKEVKIVDAFVKFGRGGSFVDNAGAGGVFVDVDPETGILRSDGYDEYGRVYKTHPGTGISFKGFKLKSWKKALKLAKSSGDKFPGVSFIGWDIAYTRWRKWIIVEGNAKPQIICNQTSQGIGLKQKFLSETGGKEA